jgi:hypothetical protein
VQHPKEQQFSILNCIGIDTPPSEMPMQDVQAEPESSLVHDGTTWNIGVTAHPFVQGNRIRVLSPKGFLSPPQSLLPRAHVQQANRHSVPHLFALFLAKGWETTNPRSLPAAIAPEHSNPAAPISRLSVFPVSQKSICT